MSAKFVTGTEPCVRDTKNNCKQASDISSLWPVTKNNITIYLSTGCCKRHRIESSNSNQKSELRKCVTNTWFASDRSRLGVALEIYTSHNNPWLPLETTLLSYQPMVQSNLTSTGRYRTLGQAIHCVGSFYLQWSVLQQ